MRMILTDIIRMGLSKLNIAQFSLTLYFLNGKISEATSITYFL